MQTIENIPKNPEHVDNVPKRPENPDCNVQKVYPNFGTSPYGYIGELLPPPPHHRGQILDPNMFLDDTTRKFNDSLAC